jgi:hypothetical protein
MLAIIIYNNKLNMVILLPNNKTVCIYINYNIPIIFNIINMEKKEIV